MSGTAPFAHFPDSIRLDLGEVWILLQAVDVGLALVPPGSADAALLNAARVLLTARLWPELGDLLDEEEED